MSFYADRSITTHNGNIHAATNESLYRTRETFLSNRNIYLLLKGSTQYELLHERELLPFLGENMFHNLDEIKNCRVKRYKENEDLNCSADIIIHTPI